MDFSCQTFFDDLVEELVNVYLELSAGGFDLPAIERFIDTAPMKSSIDRVPSSATSDKCKHFVYEPLIDCKTIRLLLLHKGSGTHPLEGSLRHEPLGPVIDYDTVSYAWGDDSMPCSMLVNGHRMPLTQSLYDALQRLRRHNRDRTVWADGVCINQADSVEKSKQVSLMPQIFDQTRVRVYLGMAANDSDILPDFFERLAECIHKGQPLQSIFADHTPCQSARIWRALYIFLHRPWFTRLWVAPEVILARDVRFICGDWEIGWRPLLQLVDSLSGLHQALGRSSANATILEHDAQRAASCLGMMLAYRVQRCPTSRRFLKLIGRVEGRETETNNLATTSNDKLDFITQALRHDRNLLQWIERLVQAIPSPREPSGIPILPLFTSFIYSSVTKPQDRLYVLSALAGDITSKDFPPDYCETAEEANIRFSKVLVTKGQGIDVLYHARMLSITGDRLPVPSWAADWTTPRGMHDHWLKPAGAYRGGFYTRRTCPSLVTLVNDRVLKVSGHVLANCQSPAIVFPLLEGKNLETAPSSSTFREWSWSLVQSDIMLFRGDIEYFTGQSWPEVRVRTLVADTLPIKELETDSDFIDDVSGAFLGHHDQVQRSAAEQERRAERRARWMRVMMETMSGFSAVKTTEGYVGIVPSHTAITTDVIVMIEGSDMPFVLRPCHSEPGHYGFVGACYIHGMMGGEAWKRCHAENTEMFLV